MEKDIKKSSKSVSLQNRNWEKIKTILELGNGTFRSTSHVIEYSMIMGLSLNSILQELKENVQTETKQRQS